MASHGGPKDVRKVDISKYNLIVGVRKDLLEEMSRTMFDDINVTHVSKRSSGDTGSFEYYLERHLDTGENTVRMRSPLQLESKVSLNSSTRSIIFNYSFDESSTVSLDIYQMKSDLMLNLPKDTSMPLTPRELDDAVKIMNLKYSETPKEFFPILTAKNYVEKKVENMASPERTPVTYRTRILSKTVTIKSSLPGSVGEPWNGYGRRGDVANSRRKRTTRSARSVKKFYERAEKPVKIQVPSYKGMELGPDEKMLADIFERAGGPVAYGYGQDESKLKDRRYKAAFDSLWQSGATKRQVQDGAESFVLAYEK